MPRFSAPPSRSPAGMASACLCGSLQANRPRRGQVHRPATGGNGGVWTRLVWLRTPHFARHSLPLVRHHGLTRFPPRGEIQLCEGSIDSAAGRRQKDYETLQYPGAVQENVSGTEVVETPPP